MHLFVDLLPLSFTPSHAFEILTCAKPTFDSVNKVSQLLGKSSTGSATVQRLYQTIESDRGTLALDGVQGGVAENVGKVAMGINTGVSVSAAAINSATTTNINNFKQGYDLSRTAAKTLKFLNIPLHAVELKVTSSSLRISLLFFSSYTNTYIFSMNPFLHGYSFVHIPHPNCISFFFVSSFFKRYEMLDRCF